MSSSILLESIIILCLILLNGSLALAEIAIIAARKTKLQNDAEVGVKGAQTALDLAENPTDFLSTVQIGITTVGILAGVFGGATITNHLAQLLAQIPVLEPYSQLFAVVTVVLVITYFTLVLGELAPKSYALTRPEEIAVRISSPMMVLSKITSPLVRFLSSSTRLVLSIFRVKPVTNEQVTESEILMLIEQGTLSGALLLQEQEMMEGVLELGDRRVDALMIPRTEIARLDLENSPEENRRIYLNAPYTHLPVEKGTLDQIVGVVNVQDLLVKEITGESIDLESMIEEPVFIPENASALMALNQMRTKKIRIAIVIDEFSGTQGLVTLFDIVEGVVGDLPSIGDDEPPEIVMQKDGSYLIDGLLPIDEFKELFALESLPGEERASFQTVSGFVMACLGRVPVIGDKVKWESVYLDVIELDGFRVNKVLVHPVAVQDETNNVDS